jgi:hypothetical protein
MSKRASARFPLGPDQVNVLLVLAPKQPDLTGRIIPIRFMDEDGAVKKWMDKLRSDDSEGRCLQMVWILADREFHYRRSMEESGRHEEEESDLDDVST